jgi:Tol biopolymer transport system component
MKKTISLTLVLALCMVAKADFTFGEPTNLGPPVNSSSRDREPSISADGLTLYFTSNRSGGHGSYDIWITEQQTSDRNPEGY